MNRRAAVAASMLAAVLALTGAANGCQSGTAAGSGGGAAPPPLGSGCTPTIHGPVLDSTGRIVSGGVTVECKLGAKSYHHEADLQYQTSNEGAVWVLESHDSDSHYRRPLLVGADCRVGSWRIHYTATVLRYDSREGTEDMSSEMYVSRCS